jgi:hypothetical protein
MYLCTFQLSHWNMIGTGRYCRNGCMKDVVAYHEVHAPLQWDILSVYQTYWKILICHGITLPYPHASIYIQNSSIVYPINHGHRTWRDGRFTGATKYWTDPSRSRVRTRNSRMDVQILCRHNFVRKHIDADWNFSALSKSNTKLAIELSRVPGKSMGL